MSAWEGEDDSFAHSLMCHNSFHFAVILVLELYVIISCCKL